MVKKVFTDRQNCPQKYPVTHFFSARYPSSIIRMTSYLAGMIVYTNFIVNFFIFWKFWVFHTFFMDFPICHLTLFGSIIRKERSVANLPEGEQKTIEKVCKNQNFGNINFLHLDFVCTIMPPKYQVIWHSELRYLDVKSPVTQHPPVQQIWTLLTGLP